MAKRYIFSFVFTADPQWGWDGTLGQGITWNPNYDKDKEETESIVSIINNGINGYRSSFVLLGGDFTDGPNFESEIEMQAVKDAYNNLNCQYFPIPGNHDKLEFMKTVWNHPAGNDPNTIYEGSGAWSGVKAISDLSFWFEIANWTIVGLQTSDDSNGSTYRIYDDPTALKIKNAIKKNAIIFSHHPVMYSVNNSYPNINILSRIAQTNRAKIALNGHLINTYDVVVGNISCYSSMQVHLERARTLWFDCFSDGSFTMTEILGESKALQ